MILLNSLMTPNIGLMFWTILIFIILLLLLRKFAWKPIVSALKARDESIEKALNEARIAREEITGLVEKNEKLLKEAKIERDNLLKDAREKGNKLINASVEDARKESKRILAETREMVKAEKESVFKELKNEIADLVINVTAKVVRRELRSPKDHKAVIEDILKEL